LGINALAGRQYDKEQQHCENSRKQRTTRVGGAARGLAGSNGWNGKEHVGGNVN
jgi:hypothetical protein